MKHNGEKATQLAAIMFTDIAGYSRLMEEDEERTIALLTSHNEIVLPLVEAAGGDVIDAIGDGLFILFPSVRDTVTCASSIQDAIAAHNDTTGPNEQFRLRIGIHLGEIWRAEGRAYGNGVNIAARVQPFAPPGGICVTEDVHRQIATRQELQTRSIGRHELKNISRRVELFHIVTGHETKEHTTDSDARASYDGPELDAVKARILDERAKISQRHQARNRDSVENRLESKIYQVVETVMDTAIETWDTLPPEKKREAVAELSSQKRPEKTKKRKSGEKENDSSSDMGVGLVAGIGFGLGYFFFEIGWMIWPFILIGVLPFLVGAGKWIKRLHRQGKARRERPARIETQLIEVAKKQRGSLTVVQAADALGITLQEAEASLDTMTRRGYVVQTVYENGSVAYEFPGFLPGSNDLK